MLQLCINYINFLERVADMFQGIGTELLIYDEFLDTIPNLATPMERSYTTVARPMALAYLDILRFCHAAYRLFSNHTPSKYVNPVTIEKL
jgi:hypothetical protein